jgi:glycosidase
MSQLGGSLERAKQAATVLLTSPGVPFIYYGEEIGMNGKKPDERIRTPMQWSAEANAGFSTSPPWESLQSDYTQINVSAESVDPASLWSHDRSLVQLRNGMAHSAWVISLR